MKKLLVFAEQVFTVLSLLLYSGGLLALILSGGASQGDGRPVPSDYPLLWSLFFLNYAVAFFLLLPQHKQVLDLIKKEKFIGILIAMALVSILWSDAPAITIRRDIALIGTTLFGIYLATRYSLKQQLRLLGWMFGIVVALSLVFIAVLPQYGIMGGVHTGSWRGIYTHKNILGRFMTLGSIIFLMLAADTRRNRFFLWGGFSLSLILLVLSNSKTALISFAILLVAFCIYQLWQRRYDMLIPILITVVVIGGNLLIRSIPESDVLPSVTSSPPSVTNPSPSVTSSPQGLTVDTTLTGRTKLWLRVLEMIWKRPWLGYGYRAFWRGWKGPSAYVWQEARWEPPHAHNGFLELWLDLGILGVLIYLIGFAASVFRALTRLRLNRTIENLWPLVYLSYLVLINLTESSLMVQNNFFWVLYVTVTLSMLIPPKQLTQVEARI